MLHEIQPGFFDIAYRPERPDNESLIVCIKDGAVLVSETKDGIRFPAFCEFEPPGDAYTYLFAIDGTKFFLAGPAEPQGGYAYRGLMEFRHGKPKALAFAAAAACHLEGWYSKSRFCGRCGSGMAHDEKERMMRCGCCGNMAYPKISPAVIVGVTDGDRLLMTKYSGRIYKRYALVAGFAEVGEAIEDTVRREVLEEVGVRVKNLRYYKSQPWPFSDSLLMGFYAELDGPDTITLDETELECAEWIRRKDIEVEADDVSLTNEMIVAFKEGRA
jgi:NAD+ diphosphatase